MTLGHRLLLAKQQHTERALQWVVDEWQRWTTADEVGIAVQQLADEDPGAYEALKVLIDATPPVSVTVGGGSGGSTPGRSRHGDPGMHTHDASAVPAADHFLESPAGDRREHAVPCSHCGRMTWGIHAVCSDCWVKR